MTEDYEATLDEVPARYTFEESVKYKELSFWVRTEVVLCAGPDDRSGISDCKHDFCGVRFPHTKNAMRRLARYWGGENGAH